MMPAASLSEGAVVSSGVLEVLWVGGLPTLLFTTCPYPLAPAPFGID